MLSSLSNYFFNASAPLEDVTNLRNNNTIPEYQTQELDGDWLLVNQLEGESEDLKPIDFSEFETSETCSTPPSQLVTKNQKQAKRRSRNQALKLHVQSLTPDSNGSPPSSPNQQMDGSWYVTPPPCFTASTGPIALETSPMENLLIEHPSMSVYGPFHSFSLIPGSVITEVDGNADNLDIWIRTSRLPSLVRNAENELQDAVATRNPRIRHRAAPCPTLDTALEERRLMIRSRGYLQQREQRKMKPSYMERQNLTRQCQSAKKHRNQQNLKQPFKCNRC